MSKEELATLVTEMREEFQIPPYYSDAQLSILAQEGEWYSRGIKPRL